MTDLTDATFAERLIGCLDLTELSDDRPADKVDQLLDKARTPFGPVAAVCVWPDHVKRAAMAVKGTPIQIATVVNFPGGQEPWARTQHDIRLALANGATEIDMVVDYRRGVEDPHAVTFAVRQVKDAAGGLPVKAILETGMLADTDEMQLLAGAALTGGADFVKTSTGKVETGATMEAADALLDAIAAAGRGGLKVSGGVRSFAEAKAYADLAAKKMGDEWVSPRTFRIGASSLLTDLIAVARGEHGTAASGSGY
ncbi:deoxyribose-phosphate aldolase [Notoacmeibacter sp. MSK16QG-6]|uniref:deoxyribose-phosphate aldolase n=1 Tax=Notoacmeibacter sp. MSK16QG-6 TaxID=2957982 RepID=UPI00209C91F2|nr:deoxyribose-phosphate aldolase [Notoacmeibacter sp. MSK16QG-6]MCP1198194.1 deoxyribose-phosphate aldolase [Notoacmeibacter sp. MSK16QG-6]